MVVGSLTVETDVVVIGSGPGGYVSAIRAAQLGKEVTLIEREKRIGGVCLHWGCIPTKALIHASNYMHDIQHLEWMGVKVHDYTVDVKAMKTWKDGIVDKLTSGIESLCKKHGIEVVNGVATFKDENTLMISGQSDINTIKFKNAIIATGSRPFPIPGFDFDNPLVMSSRDAINFDDIPKKLVIIGGGYIGTEMGTVFGKMGSEVHIVELADHLINVVDSELVDVVAKKISEFNVTYHLKAKALGMEEKDGRVSVSVEVDGKKDSIDADKVLVVVGRKPNSDTLGLEAAGVSIDQKGFISVDQQMKTSKDHIFAIGDVVGQPMLAHKATREGKVAAEVICGEPSAFDNKVIPFVVFNDPEIASVGLTQDQAKEKGMDVNVGKFPFNALGRALTLNATEGFVKIISEKNTNIVLGVHAVGANVSDIIGEASLAIEMGATVEDLALTIHPHPTIGESLMEASEVSLHQAIHLYTGK